MNMIEMIGSFVGQKIRALQALLDPRIQSAETNIDQLETTAVAHNTRLVALEGEIQAGNKDFQGNVIIRGNLITMGDQVVLQVQEVQVSDNEIVLNKDEPGDGVTAGFSGIRVYRGPNLDPYLFQFREFDQSFAIGQDGDLQPVATREDAPLDGAMMVWDSDSHSMRSKKLYSHITPFELVAHPQANSWTSCAFGAGTFVAVAADGSSRVITTINGVDFVLRNAAQANTWRDVCFSGQNFIAVCADGTNRAMTSPDGVSWTVRTATNLYFRCVRASASGTVIAGANPGSLCAKTTDHGVTWATKNLPENAGIGAIATNDSGVWLLGSTNGKVYRSEDDGETWALTANMAIAGDFWALEYHAGRWYAGVGGVNFMASEDDGETWTQVASLYAYTMVKAGEYLVVVSGYSSKVAVIDSNHNISITDKSPLLDGAAKLAYGNGLLFGVSEAGVKRFIRGRIGLMMDIDA